MEIKIEYIALTKIMPSTLNPRKTILQDPLEELAQNIKEIGVLQPITVRPTDTKFEIVCGERRWRASVIARTKTIPVVVRSLTDDEALDLAITENLQREEVSPFDEATAFRVLLDRGTPLESIMDKFGKSKLYIRKRLLLLNLIPEVIEKLDAGFISMSQAVEISKFTQTIQAEVNKNHLLEGYSYRNWIDLNAKALYEKIENTYSDSLSVYTFDTSHCKECPNCSCNYSLFEETDELRCSDVLCRSQKQEDHNYWLAIDMRIIYGAKGFITASMGKLAKRFVESGDHVEKTQSYYRKSDEAEVSKHINSTTKDIFIDLTHEIPTLVLLDKNTIAATTEESDKAAKLARLESRLKRNAELKEEKIIAGINEYAGALTYSQLSKVNLTEEETRLDFALKLSRLTSPQQKTIRQFNGYLMPFSVVLEIAAKADQQVYAYVNRCTLINSLNKESTPSLKSALLEKWMCSFSSKPRELREQYNIEYKAKEEAINLKIAELK